MAKNRTEVIVETSEILILKRSRTFLRIWCEDCGREVSMLPLQEAALLCGYGVHEIHSMMEDHHIHFSYLRSETPCICVRSLCLL